MDRMGKAPHFSGPMRILTAVVVLNAASGNLPAESSGRAEYLETTGNTSLLLTSWEVADPNGYLLESKSAAGEVHEVFVDKSLETLWWSYRYSASRSDFKAVRTATTIAVRGIFEGKPLDRRVEIDSAPWYQSLERSLEPLARSPVGTTTELWVLQPDTLTARKIQARNEGTDRITIEDRLITAARVKISLPGFLSVFWSSSYWYRLSDGKFVRFEGLHGPPGSPLTTVELLRSLGDAKS